MAEGTSVVSSNGAKKTDLTSPMHPPYFQMISEAITALKERSGSSQPAIAKFIGEKYEAALPPNFKKLLSVQLRKFSKSGKLVRIKNSYNLSPTEKLKLGQKTAKASIAHEGDANKVSEKGVKTKRLSQVKTPEVLKNKEAKSTRMKRLSQVKTPDDLQKKKKTKN